MAENDIQNSKTEDLDTIDTQTTTSDEQNESENTPEVSKSQDIQKIAKDTTQVVAKGVSSAFESATTAVAEGSRLPKKSTTLPKRQTLQSKSLSRCKNTLLKTNKI